MNAETAYTSALGDMDAPVATRDGPCHGDSSMTTSLDRYLRIIEWARRRYTVNGWLVAYVCHSPTRYEQIERAAARKYLGMME